MQQHSVPRSTFALRPLNKGWLARLKLGVAHTAPGLFSPLSRIWLRFKRRRIEYILDQLTDSRGLVVRSGPFLGMRYIRWSAGSVLLPKILGSYEQELHPSLEVMCRNTYSQIIDIGCAEGYYAVGLARRFPGATIYAYDADPAAQQLCRLLATANEVADRMIIAGACTVDGLRLRMNERSLIVCDCEGYELELLQPHLLSGLSRCDLIVELHDDIDPSITSTLLARFESTHHMTIIESAKPFLTASA